VNLDPLKKFLLDKWWIFSLIFIFIFAYWIRSVGNVPDRILSFDPTFFYRFTKYFADWGHFPVWDELSYYVGRGDTSSNSRLMWIITGTIYNIFKSSASLFTIASTMAAIYGALLIVPAFLLGRELSNKYGGVLAAALTASAPQILVRTFGASYDTDQMALFFLLFTLYAGFRCLRKKTVESLATAILIYSAAMLAWGDSMFTFAILCGYSVVLLFVQKFMEKSKGSLKNFSYNISLLLVVLIGVQAIGFITNTYDAIGSILSIATFAQKPEIWIVNISIAELQPFNVFNLQGWMQAVGRFQTGDATIDIGIFTILIGFMATGLFYSYKKNINAAPLITAIFIIAFYVTTRGVRFTEFSSALFLVIIAAGFGYAMEALSNRGIILRSSVLGIALIVVFFAFGITSQVGFSLGPDVDKNWDDAWKWMKESTPEDALIGTWWDPGHMIAGYAERRNIADGAHCPHSCKYTINDRIVDLGKIMVTGNESESLQLIRKYQGTSSKVYWIASDDLIPKFQWPMYFGTGCGPQNDAKKCPTYISLPLQGNANSNDGRLIFRNYLLSNQAGDYQSVMLFETEPKVAFYNNNGNVYMFIESLTQSDGQLVSVGSNENVVKQVFSTLDPIFKQINVKPTNQTVPLSAWFTKGYNMAVLIPLNLRESVFTKMFLLEGDGLNHFTKAFSNDKVKIYEVVP